MAIAVEMPKPGNTVEECLLARWAKRPGERVETGELIAEIETDKATFEIQAPAGGMLLATFVKEGDLVPVFTNLCAIGEPGENFEHLRPSEGGLQAAPGLSPAEAGLRTELRPPTIPATQGPLSPRARRFAAEHGLNPGAVAGSGPGGRVLEGDLRELFYQQPRPSSLARKRIEEGYEAEGEGSGIGGMLLARDLAPPAERVPSIREKIARRMREAMAASAQYTLNSSAGAAGLLALRKKIKQARLEPDINLNEMVMFCAVKALLAMPELNMSFAGGRIVRHSAVNIGFACDTPRGLLVPVIHESDKLSLAELSRRMKELAGQAAEGNISPDDLAGATFTVSNLGSLGIESFTPILVPPQVALLGVNTIEPRPMRRDGAVEFEDRIGLSLTCDHQWIDGAPGARFLQVVRERIESIESICGLNL